MGWFSLHPAWFLVWYAGYIAAVFTFTPRMQERYSEKNVAGTVALALALAVFWPISFPLWGLKKLYRKYRPSK